MTAEQPQANITETAIKDLERRVADLDRFGQYPKKEAMEQLSAQAEKEHWERALAEARQNA